MARPLLAGLLVLGAASSGFGTAAAQQIPPADRPWIGALLDVQYTSAPSGGQVPFRLTVVEVHDGGPADIAGLRPGDRITSVNGRPVTFDAWMRDYTSLTPGATLDLEVAQAGGGTGTVRLVAQSRPDTLATRLVDEQIAVARNRVFRSLDSMLVTITTQLREQSTSGFSIRIRTSSGGADSIPVLAREVDARIRAVEGTPRPPQALRRATDMDGRLPRVMAPYMAGDAFILGGAQVRSVTGRLAEYFGVDDGALVTEVLPGSLAAQVGFRPGDVIVAVAGRETGTVDRLRAALFDLPIPFDVSVVRQGDDLRLRFPGPDR